MKSAALALLLAVEAHAAVIGVVPMRGGAHLQLHDQPGICRDGAMLIEYHAPGKPALPGCWVIREGAIRAAFLDGDGGTIPIEAVEKPQTL